MAFLGSRVFEKKLLRYKRVLGNRKTPRKNTPKKVKVVECQYCAGPMVYRKGKKFCGLTCKNRNRNTNSVIWYDLKDLGGEFKFLRE